MTESALRTLWIGATRYYLGRMTAAVHDFCGLLTSEWPSLPVSVQRLIQRDVMEAFERDDKRREETGEKMFLPLGDDCDRAAWEKVRGLWDE